MLVVSETYQNYQKRTINNQLTGFGEVGGGMVVWCVNMRQEVQVATEILCTCTRFSLIVSPRKPTTHRVLTPSPFF
jgi:hypothetical protein